MILHSGGKAISATIEALKSQPLLLAIILVNVLSLLAGSYVLHQVSGATERKDQLLQELVSKCVRPNA
ncbi:hypothetical protein SAMN05443247_06537 [Bradyrhizobium erythrophlei]|nr:hypothetical protein SAMN05443247_06537 [Bradyrhizobium erythrophlei]